MQVVLHVSNGKANIKQVALRSDTVIGRGSECNLKIASSLVSRRHCQISIKDSRVSIRDFGSANGTYVNGHVIPKDQSVPLLPGSVVVVGPLKFVVQYGPPSSKFLGREKNTSGAPSTMMLAEQAALMPEGPAPTYAAAKLPKKQSPVPAKQTQPVPVGDETTPPPANKPSNPAAPPAAAFEVTAENAATESSQAEAAAFAFLEGGDAPQVDFFGGAEVSVEAPEPAADFTFAEDSQSADAGALPESISSGVESAPKPPVAKPKKRGFFDFLGISKSAKANPVNAPQVTETAADAEPVLPFGAVEETTEETIPTETALQSKPVAAEAEVDLTFTPDPIGPEPSDEAPTLIAEAPTFLEHFPAFESADSASVPGIEEVVGNGAEHSPIPAAEPAPTATPDDDDLGRFLGQFG